MAKMGPIVIVEDDRDDEEILEEVLKELDMPNKIVWFTLCDSAFDYLKATTEQPFIILSDVNLPRQSGMDFKKRIDNDKGLRAKSIPFVFYSTSVDPNYVTEAYTQMTVQGYFSKGNSYEEIKRKIKLIMDYWKDCKHPNS